MDNQGVGLDFQQPKPKPQFQPSKLFVPAPAFLASVPTEIDWMVQGVIERGSNGVFCAVPKGGKSWAAVDLAISLAMGADWLGFKIPRPVKVALVSREDNPSLTAWRLRHLFAGKRGGDPNLIEQNLYVNSRRQSAELMLDNADQMAELMRELRRLKPEFSIFDVLNVLHCADENDNTEMRSVLRLLSQVQAEIGCGIGVIHHLNKNAEGSMTQRLRGSSAIAGWFEWLIGISLEDPEQKIRKAEFELKAAEPPEPIYWKIYCGSAGSAELARVEYTPKESKGSAGRFLK